MTSGRVGDEREGGRRAGGWATSGRVGRVGGWVTSEWEGKWRAGGWVTSGRVGEEREGG